MATAGLSPADIAAPIREVLRKQLNATVALLEVTRVDADRRQVFFNYLDGAERSLPYDYLILATGVQQSYFGHDEFAPFAPGLKSITDAEAIRAKLLKAFEIAEIEVDPRNTGICSPSCWWARADRRGDGGGDRRHATGDAQVRLPTY